MLENDARLGFAYGEVRFFGDWDGLLPAPQYDPYQLLYRHLIGSTCLMRREHRQADAGLGKRGERRPVDRHLGKPHPLG